jgi:GNAT superfamily N-acetyltransferase
VVSQWFLPPAERFSRRGFGRAELAHALLEARSEGAIAGLLGATPAGKALYDRTGWTTLENWRMFASVESAQFSGWRAVELLGRACSRSPARSVPFKQAQRGYGAAGDS